MHTYSAVASCGGALASDVDVGGIHGRVNGGPVLASSASLYGSANEVMQNSVNSDGEAVVKEGTGSGAAGSL